MCFSLKGKKYFHALVSGICIKCSVSPTEISKNSLARGREWTCFGLGHLFHAVAFFTSVLKNSFKPQFGFKAVKSTKPQIQENQQFFLLSEFYIEVCIEHVKALQNDRT